MLLCLRIVWPSGEGKYQSLKRREGACVEWAGRHLFDHFSSLHFDTLLSTFGL